MSYGYQGPPVTPFQGKTPPKSFDFPPGTPSAPNAPPCHQGGNIGFSQPPTSFSMPQPHFPYPSSSPYPSSNPYDSFCSSRPYVSPNPYPSQSSSYPCQASPATTSIPYPQLPPQPSLFSHSQQLHQPSSYPQQLPQASFHPQPSYPQSSMHVSSGMPLSQSMPATMPQPSMFQESYNSFSQPQGSGIYPNLQYASNPSYTSNPPTSPNYGSNSLSPNRGRSYHGGQGPGTNFSSHNAPMLPYSAQYGALAPRISNAKPKISPTVVPEEDFNSRKDAEALRKAMKGFGTNEKTIINILAYRTNIQRQEIELQFKTLYGKDLIKELKSELSGNFEDLIIAMMTPLPQYYAKELHHAMAGIGTEESVLIEVLCTLSNHEIRVIKQAYQFIYGNSLEDDIIDDTSGNFKRLMVSLCCANRDESFNVNQDAAREDARQLLQAGELRFGTDESTFNAILVQRNMAQLHEIFAEYANITGHLIEDAIENEFSGDIKKALLAIVKVVKDRAGFFAEKLYKSMKGLGTDDRRLIRIVVTRSEIDMGEIKEAFMEKYGKSLEDMITEDCSGHYKKCLLALISS